MRQKVSGFKPSEGSSLTLLVPTVNTLDNAHPPVQSGIKNSISRGQPVLALNRKSKALFSTHCLLSPVPIFSSSYPAIAPDLTDLYAVMAREIDLHENWVNEYQRSKAGFMDRIYHMFERLVQDYFKQSVKVG